MKRALVESVVKPDRSSDANVPSLVTFASSDDIPSGAKFTCFRKVEDGSLQLTAETEKMSYVNRSQPHDLMLAVVDKSTGGARLVPLRQYHLSPALAADTAEMSDGAAAARPTHRDVGRVLGLERWQRHQLRSQRLAVTAGSAAVAAALQTAVQTVNVCGAELAEPAAEQGLVPPQHAAAETPDQVYRRQDVIPDRLWGQVAAAEDRFKQALAKHASTNEYIVKLVAAYENSDPDRYTMTMYSFYMLRFLRYQQGMKIKKAWKQLMIPPPVLDHLKTAFMERSHTGWDRSDRLLDKLVCYFMVVALWIHDYKVDLLELASAARLQDGAVRGGPRPDGDRQYRRAPAAPQAARAHHGPADHEDRQNVTSLKTVRNRDGTNRQCYLLCQAIHGAEDHVV